MSIILYIIGGLIISGTYLFTRWRTKKEFLNASSEQLAEKEEDLAFMREVAVQMTKQMDVLENALTSQLVSRSSEVGSPPPSGAYHTAFFPTGDGKVLMVYICLDTGHVARWHFHSPEALEQEGRRFLRVAQEVRDNTLPETPQVLNVQIGNNGMIH